MGIFSRAQRYEQTFRLEVNPAPEGPFSAFCFGGGAVTMTLLANALSHWTPGTSVSHNDR
jgi:hypothetical protein